MDRTVWSSGCQSWYLKDGRNATLWPAFTFQYWWQTRWLDLQDYQIVPEPAVGSEPAVEPAMAR